jgi:hypothetical protein
MLDLQTVHFIKEAFDDPDDRFNITKDQKDKQALKMSTNFPSPVHDELAQFYYYPLRPSWS